MIVRIVKSFLIFSFCPFLSCFMKKSEKRAITLPGIIAVNIKDSFYVFDNADTIGYRFPIKGKDFSYAGFRWMNETSNLVGTDYVEKEKRGIDRGSLVCFNVMGQIIRTIYKANSGEIMGEAYPSRKDRRLLCVLERKGDINRDPLEGLNREKSAMIINYV